MIRVAVRHQNAIKHNFLILCQVVIKIGQKLLVSLRKVARIHNSLYRAAANNVAICARKRITAWVFDMNLCHVVSQSLPRLA